MSGFDMNSVHERLRECVDTEAKRDVYREELFDWTDGYTENLASRSAAGDDADAAIARNAIVKLWVAFANMEFEEMKLENVLAIYKEAAADPIAGTQSSLYRYYIEFLNDREEGEVAEYPFQHAFFYGLCKAELDTQWLWGAYLEIHNKQHTSPKTMQELFSEATAAMEEDEIFEGMQLEKPTGISTTVKQEPDDRDVQEEGDAGEEQEDQQEEVHAAEKEGKQGAFSKIKQEPDSEDYKPNAAVVVALLNLDDIDGLTPELLVKGYHQAPPMLFEPLATGETMRALPPLSPQDNRLLEDYLGVSLKDTSSLQKCTWLFDIVEGLWVAQALKERSYAQYFSTLKELHATERIRAKERAHTTGGTTSMADLAKHSKKLEDRLAVQREVLAAVVNKSLLALIGEQHRLLSQLSFPLFSTALWEKVESHVINRKLGAPPALLDQSVRDVMIRQQQLLGAVLSRSGRLDAHATAAHIVVSRDLRQKNTRFSDRTPDKQYMSVQPAPQLHIPPSASAVTAPAPPMLTVPVAPIKTEKVPAQAPVLAPATATAPATAPAAAPATEPEAQTSRKRKVPAPAPAPTPAPTPAPAPAPAPTPAPAPAPAAKVPAAKKLKADDSNRVSTTKQLDLDASELLAAVKPAATRMRASCWRR